MPTVAQVPGMRPDHLDSIQRRYRADKTMHAWPGLLQVWPVYAGTVILLVAPMLAVAIRRERHRVHEEYPDEIAG